MNGLVDSWINGLVDQGPTFSPSSRIVIAYASPLHPSHSSIYPFIHPSIHPIHSSNHPVHFTTYRGLIAAAAPRSLALKRTTMSWLKSASLPSGDWVTVIGQFSM